MSPVLSRAPVTTAIVDRLRLRLPILFAPTLIPVGDGRVPPEAEKPDGVNLYAIVYELAGPFVTESLDGTQDAAVPAVQVTCVGQVREQVSRLADGIRAELCDGWVPTVAGVRVSGISSSGIPPVERVGVLFQTAEAFDLLLGG